MQGQGNTSEPSCRTVEFEHVSSASNLGFGQEGFQNDGSNAPLGSENSSAYTPSSDSSSMPSERVSGRQRASLSSWTSVGASSSLHAGNQNNCTKLQNDWTSSSKSSNGYGQWTQESQSQATNTLPSEVDLNINHTDNLNHIQSLSQVSDLNEYTRNVATSSQVSGSGLYYQLQAQHVSSSGCSGSHEGPHEGSSNAAHHFHDNSTSQQGLLLGGRCSLHKRKGIDLVSGQSSASGSSSSLNLDLDIPHGDISTRLRTATRIMASDSYSFGNTTGNYEGYSRNSRLRTSQPLPSDSSLSNNWPLDNTGIVNHANTWTDCQQSAPPVPLNQLSEPELLGGHANSHNVSVTSSLPSDTFPISRSGSSTSRAGGRSIPFPTTADRNAIEEPNLRSVQRNNSIDHSMVSPLVNTRDRDQDPNDAGLSNNSTVVRGHAVTSSQTSSVFAAYEQPGDSAISLVQRCSNFRRPLHASNSESRGHNVNLPPHSGHFSISPEVGRIPARVYRSSFMAVPPILPEGQNEGAPSIPLPGRHHRNSEMYMAEVLRRMDPSFFEDVLFFDRVVLVGAPEFHDRHREMRLDVDNMSYEELLALEERIGNVDTGLDEEKIKKCLSEQKFVSITSEATLQVEPCCICQEEYVEGEDLGQLDCGHDFHSACIKQWLVIRNLCPICKNTALNI